MKRTQIIYYISKTGANPVKDFLDSLEKRQKAKVFRIFETIEEYGLISILPHVKKLKKTPLWEMRILGQDNIRIFYIQIIVDEVIVLHGFLKKKQKTSYKEINLAMKRYNEIV